MKKIIIFFLIILLSPLHVISAPPKNETIPIEPDPIVVIDFEKEYIDLTKQYKERIRELELIIENNPITYYEFRETIDNEVFIKYNPYNIDFVRQRKLHNPAYGEDSTALGQFVDNYIDLNNLTVSVNVTRNSAIDAIELEAQNITAYENFTTYTEVDVDGDITVFDYNITWDTMRRDADSYVYYDFGAGSWNGDFYWEFEWNITIVDAGDATSATMIGICLSNTTQSFDEMRAVGNPYLALVVSQFTNNNGIFQIYIWEYNGANVIVQRLEEPFGTDYQFSENTAYYMTFERVGNNVSAFAYSDEDRTIRVANYTDTGNGDSYRYLHAANNWGRNVDPADTTSGYIKNLDIGNQTSGYVTSGYCISVDYLSDPVANGVTLVQMENSTIPSNTQITVQFSDDNATWVNNAGVAGFNTLTEGFLSIDLRNLNYSSNYYIMKNLTTTDITITPRLYQSRLITSEGLAAAAAGGGINSASLIMVILLFSIGGLTLLGVKKR